MTQSLEEHSIPFFIIKVEGNLLLDRFEIDKFGRWVLKVLTESVLELLLEFKGTLS